MKSRNNKYLLQDFVIIFISIIVMIFLIKTQILVTFLNSAKDFKVFSSFFAGLFFTSIFTTGPAIVALGEIAKISSVLQVAILGGVGAVVGDLIIFRFIRDRFSEHIMILIKHKNSKKEVKIIHHLKFFRWFTFLLGGLIIASPLPDELGIGLLGFSKMNLRWFIPMSFVFNSLGILFIGIIANSL